MTLRTRTWWLSLERRQANTGAANVTKGPRLCGRNTYQKPKRHSQSQVGGGDCGSLGSSTGSVACGVLSTGRSARTLPVERRLLTALEEREKEGGWEDVIPRLVSSETVEALVSTMCGPKD